MKKQKLLKNLRHRLSLLLCLMAFLAVGQGAWGYNTYYIDGREFYGTSGIAIPAEGGSYFFKNRQQNITLTAVSTITGNNQYILNQPEQGMITFSFSFSNEGTGQIKLALTNPSKNLPTSMEGVGSSQIGSHNCIKIKDTGWNWNTDHVEYTDYSGPTPSPSETTPEVRVGAAPVVAQNTGATISAYLAKQGCHSGAVATVSKITAYYSVETPTKSTTTKQTITGTYTSGNLYDITIPASELNKFGTAIIHVKLTATNNNTSGTQEGELSDEICFQWSQCAGIITSLQINPQSTQLTVNTAQTFTYTVNDGAQIDSKQWYKDGDAVSGETGDSYTFTPTTGASFTIGLKAINNTCNPGPTGFDAEAQEYTVCVPTTAVQITDCPVNPERGTPITFTATGIGGTPAEWVWTVNGEVQQEITVEGNTSSITYTPQTATTYTVVATASSCDGTEPSAQCVFVVLKSFTATNLEKTFSACAGGHQFAWSEMFTPTPDSWSAVETTGGTDATALFTLNNGVMIWNNDGKTDGTYTYTFTAVKEGYKNATADITITYTAATTPSGTIGDITKTSGDNPTYPWTKVELSCPINVTGSDIDHVVWSCSNSGLVVSTGVAEGTATAYFKGKNVRKDTDYTITAVGQNESCGSTEPKTMVIKVQPEEEEVCY